MSEPVCACRYFAAADDTSTLVYVLAKRVQATAFHTKPTFADEGVYAVGAFRIDAAASNCFAFIHRSADFVHPAAAPACSAVASIVADYSVAACGRPAAAINILAIVDRSAQRVVAAALPPKPAFARILVKTIDARVPWTAKFYISSRAFVDVGTSAAVACGAAVVWVSAVVHSAKSWFAYLGIAQCWASIWSARAAVWRGDHDVVCCAACCVGNGAGVRFVVGVRCNCDSVHKISKHFLSRPWILGAGAGAAFFRVSAGWAGACARRSVRYRAGAVASIRRATVATFAFPLRTQRGAFGLTAFCTAMLLVVRAECFVASDTCTTKLRISAGVASWHHVASVRRERQCIAWQLWRFWRCLSIAARDS